MASAIHVQDSTPARHQAALDEGCFRFTSTHTSSPASLGLVYPLGVTRDEYNEFCRGLVATTFVNQWGNADVWKVGGKVFAIGHDNEETGRAVFSVKVAPEDFELLSQQEGFQPAPYLASRGMKWVQYVGHPGIDDVELREHLEDSHLIVSQGLSKKKQREFGLLDPDD